MIEVQKKEKETSASLLRRFSRRVQQSNILRYARAKRFNKRAKSKLQTKIDALKRVKKQKRMQYLKKIGKID